MEDQQNYQADSGDLISTFDFQKFKVILRKSWWIIGLILIFGISSAYLYIRYTKPVYEASSVVKLNVESDASILNISSPAVNQNWELSGEIELLKSKLFFDKVADALDLELSYFKYGRLLDDERYKSSPFNVSYLVKNQKMYNKPLDIELGPEGFRVPWLDESKTFRFGEEIQTENVNLLINKTNHFRNELLGNYYFIIKSRENVIDYLRSGVTVAPESFAAKTLRISFQEYNQRKAQDLIAAIDSVYISYSKAAKNQTMQQKIEFLNERIQTTEKRMTDFESYFQEFIIKYRTTSLSNNLNSTLVQLNVLDSALSELRKEQVGVELLIDELETEQPRMLNEFFLREFSDFIYNMVQDYIGKLNERDLKLRSYSENSYAIKRLDAGILDSRKRLMKTLESYLEQIKNRRQSVRFRLSSLEGSLYELPGLQNEYSKMQRSYGQQEDFMASLLRAKMEIEITLAGTTADIIVLSPASYPTIPIRPRKALIYGFSIASGLILSILFVLIRYLLNDKITSINELERLINIPILGSVPYYKQEKLSVTKLVMAKDSKSVLSESLRTIRTNMEFMNPDAKNHLISFTSTISGEGKTFLGVNLGAIIAMSGKKVCVVDLDMRKPKVHLAFNGDGNKEGVSTVLAHKTYLDKTIRKSSLENLNYLPAGPTPPNPSELLLGDSFDKLLEDLKKQFDTIILDTPPVGLVTDGILVMKKTDLQVYVIRSGYSKRSYTKTLESLKSTNHFKNLSVIFNSVTGSGGYGYGYGHDYGYGSDHGYYEETETKGILASFKSSK